MFQVDAILVPPDITMRPTAVEVQNIVGYDIKHFLNRSLLQFNSTTEHVDLSGKGKIGVIAMLVGNDRNVMIGFKR